MFISSLVVICHIRDTVDVVLYDGVPKKKKKEDGTSNERGCVVVC